MGGIATLIGFNFFYFLWKKNTLLIRGEKREGDEQSTNDTSKKKRGKRDKGAGPQKGKALQPLLKRTPQYWPNPSKELH